MVRKSLLLAKLATSQASRSLCTRVSLTNAEIITKRNAVFTEEKARQATTVPRIEKIQVSYEGRPENCKMLMNRNISTPYDCAKHLTEPIRESAAVAYVNGQPWDMHRPLEGDCTLEFAHFKDLNEERIMMVNKAFWRSCSYLLGYAVERSFKDEHRVVLHSWPAPSIQSGSFVYDVQLPLANWKPTGRELRILGAPVFDMHLKKTIFERLNVDASVAKRVFEDNPFKSEQVDSVAADSEGGSRIVLYRCGDHVDMSCGPMVANVGHIEHYQVCSVHPFETPVGLMYRFQGIAHPSAFTMSPFARSALKARAVKMNTVGLPAESTGELDQSRDETAEKVELKPEPEKQAEEETEDNHPPKVHKAAQ